jgi:putative ABC transport system permease protein
VRVVGHTPVGPDFYSDGTIIMSDRNFLKLLGGFAQHPGDLPDPEIGVVHLFPGHDLRAVQQSLRAALPSNVVVLTKAELVDQENRFQAEITGVGPIFDAGTLIGFAVGMMICYQILHTDIADQFS